ncbi:MAG: CooT family nickel-binding protein [Coriobacteriales bacterium]|jgi:predicted RNA-binding protein|nr:CooT family nickel-binding protein [Coriobacteriales bacterium]
MCISTAYAHSEKGAVLAQMVASVAQKDGSVIMTDILGKATVVPGSLRSADLTRGVLLIEPAAETALQPA